MKKLAFLLTTLLSTASFAHTKTIECSFTEPFFSIEVDLVKGNVFKTEPDWNSEDGGSLRTLVATEVKLVSTSTDPLLPSFNLVGKDGSLVLDMTLNFQGSDGMSDHMYPLDAMYGHMWGGCETDQLKAILPDLTQD